MGTANVLDVLKELNVPATFFVTGSNQGSAGGAAAQKSLTQRMWKEGHAVGNHCYNHVPQSKKEYMEAYGDLTTPAQKMAFRKNLSGNLDHFRNLLGDSALQFNFARLPGDGRTFPVFVNEIKDMGMTHVGWDFEFAPNGEFAWVPHNNWQGVTGAAASHVGLPGDGNVILFHDRHWKSPKDAVLKAVITKIKDSGYVFRKVM
jgi:peptidoglycan/xylan/chitin deacetylase (PgdA/CDA1 family)